MLATTGAGIVSPLAFHVLASAPGGLFGRCGRRQIPGTNCPKYGIHFDAHHLNCSFCGSDLGRSNICFFASEKCARGRSFRRVPWKKRYQKISGQASVEPVDLTKTWGCVACCEGVICDLASDH